MPANTPTILTYNGKNIRELSKDELIEAVQLLYKELQLERGRTEGFKEVMRAMSVKSA